MKHNGLSCVFSNDDDRLKPFRRVLFTIIPHLYLPVGSGRIEVYYVYTSILWYDIHKYTSTQYVLCIICILRLSRYDILMTIQCIYIFRTKTVCGCRCYRRIDAAVSIIIIVVIAVVVVQRTSVDRNDLRLKNYVVP